MRIQAVDDARAERTWAGRVSTGLLAVVVAVAPLTGWRGREQTGWVPDLDNASIAHRVQRLVEGHGPLLGMPSTLQGVVIGPTLTTNHPGPLQFWLLAPFFAASGKDGLGIALGSAVLNALVAVAIVVFAHRRRGPAFAAVAAVGVLLLERSLTVDLLADPFNPYASILPLAALGLLVWSAAAGDRWAYIPLVFVSAFVAQVHLSGTVPGVALFVVGAVGAVWSELGRPNRRQLLRKADRPEPRARRWWHLGAAGSWRSCSGCRCSSIRSPGPTTSPTSGPPPRVGAGRSGGGTPPASWAAWSGSPRRSPWDRTAARCRRWPFRRWPSWPASC
ncbi:hypothetical protein ACE2AJ_19045 [Aquihabitans daechungensis]|uniref:hypothetical protein n=1 Tax=Aquihabitans daechungensis TaxID=1052257 RepID=UPI003BA28F3A